MKVLIAALLFAFALVNTSYAYDQMESMLKIVTPKKTTSQKLSSVTVDDLGIVVKGEKGGVCELTYQRLVETKNPNNCKGALELETKRYVAEFREMFENGKNPIVTCTYDSANELIAINFAGGSRISGRDVFLSRRIALNMDGFRKDYPVAEEEDSVGEEALKSLGRGLFRILTYQ